MVIINPAAYSGSASGVNQATSVAKQAQIDQLKKQKEQYQNAVVGYTLLKNALSGLKEAVNELKKTSDANYSADAVKKNLHALVDSYNAFLQAGKELSGKSGALEGDQTLRRLQDELNKSLGAFDGSQEVKSLNDFGISLELVDNKTIKLSIDDRKLTALLEQKPEQVIQFLNGDGQTTGFMTNMGKMLDTGTASLDASINTRNEQIKRIDQEIQKLER